MAKSEKKAAGEASAALAGTEAQGSGPASVQIEIASAALSEVRAHADASHDAEVCGVLVGDVQDDGARRRVRISAAIRGDSVRQGSAHVTYTHETWDRIHAALERDHPGRRILGWYHSHPGFGVCFSDMDRFIQKNFFNQPEQFGLVIDPLSDEIAVVLNRSDDLAYCDAIRVDGREMRCVRPAPASPEAAAGESASERRLGQIEDRLGQVIQTLDETRSSIHRVVVYALMIVCAMILSWIIMQFYDLIFTRRMPPKHRQTVMTPVRIEDRNVLLQLEVTDWEIPPELDAVLFERAAQERRELAAYRAGMDEASRRIEERLAAADEQGLQALIDEAKERVRQREEAEARAKAEAEARTQEEAAEQKE